MWPAPPFTMPSRTACCCAALVLLPMRSCWAVASTPSLLVSWRDHADHPRRLRALAGIARTTAGSAGCRLNSTHLQGLGIDIIKTAASETSREETCNATLICHELSNSGLVESCEPDQQWQLLSSFAPNDFYYRSQDALQQIKLAEAWGVHRGSKTGSGIVVAILDSGLDLTHPDLVQNLWTNPGEIPDNGIDDDGNGYVDDVHGYDFSANDGDPSDEYGHGTHCAGTIGATSDNGIGTVGVLQNVRLMALKIGDSNGFISNALRAFEYLLKMNVPISSNSWGCPGCWRQLEKNVLERLYRRGHLLIAAAGNAGSNTDYSPMYPCNYESVLCVAATDESDKMVSFSNYGPNTVQVAAPGNNIISTYLRGTYAWESGTSMAVPFVAGLAALLLDYRPSLSGSQLRSTIESTVDALPTLAGKISTGGRVNALKAMQSVSSVTAPTSGSATTAPPVGPPPSTSPAPAPPQSCSHPICKKCGFEDFSETAAWCGFWTQSDISGALRWTRNLFFSAGTPSRDTGPSRAFEGSRFLYIEASGRSAGEVARLSSEEVNIGSGAFLSFFYHMHGSSMGRLTVELLEPGSASPIVLWTKQGQQGSMWHRARVDLSAFEGAQAVTVRFCGELRHVGQFPEQGDMAIDLVELHTMVVSDPTIGAPTSPAPRREERPTTARPSDPLHPSSTTLATLSTHSALELQTTSSATSTVPALKASTTTSSSTQLRRTEKQTTTATLHITPSTPSPATPAPAPAPLPCSPLASKICGFESWWETDLLCGFWFKDTGSLQWTKNNIFFPSTPSRDTGPSRPFENWRYLYIEASGRSAGEVARLTSKAVNIGCGAFLSFHYHMHGSSMGKLTVELLEPGSASPIVLWTKQGQQGNMWHHARIDLGSYNGAQAVKVRFSGQLQHVGKFPEQGDMAIDLVELRTSSGASSSSAGFFAIQNTSGTPEPEIHSVSTEADAAVASIVIPSVIFALLLVGFLLTVALLWYRRLRKPAERAAGTPQTAAV